MNLETRQKSQPTILSQLWQEIKLSLGWTRASYYLLSLFLATVFLIILVWWPLAEDYIGTINPDYPIWIQIDWLLIGIFLVMSLLIMAGADLKVDAWIIFVGLCGGLVIESWGTQTNLWFYYTSERPPLWIIPAWPIASLSIDRLVRLLNRWLPRAEGKKLPVVLYWLVFPGFYLLMLFFVRFTFDKSLTWMALILCAFLMISPMDHRLSLITFAAGSGLGYFLEVWGTTRECWTYYTYQTPPVFAVFAHGLAAVAFWRAAVLLKAVIGKISARVKERIEEKPERQGIN